jgi:hypothetical protein
MSKTETTAESSTGDPVTCHYCESVGPFTLASPGYLNCNECGRSFDPHSPPRGDPHAPPNTHGLTSDAVDPDGHEPGEFWCPKCGARITRGATLLEYGHRAGHAPDKNDGERCSRRPSEVDSRDPRVQAAYSMHESMGIGRFADAEDREGEGSSA